MISMKKLYYLLIGLLLLYSCDKSDVFDGKPSYTQEEFEIACGDLLYSTFLDHKELKLRRNFSEIKSFLKKENLPSDINMRINEFVLNDYLTYYPDGVDTSMYIFLKQITNSNLLKIKKETSNRRTKVDVIGDDVLRNRYDEYRFLISNIIAVSEQDPSYYLNLNFYTCNTIGVYLIVNQILTTEQIKNEMQFCTFGPYDYLNKLIETAQGVILSINIKISQDNASVGDDGNVGNDGSGISTSKIEIASKKPCNQFDERIKQVIKTEGGFVNNPNDPGKATNKGIAWGTWKAHAKKILNIDPTLDNLKKLTSVDAKKIYKATYWDKIHADEIIDGDLKYAIFDFYVNAPRSSIRTLQKTLNEVGENVTVDGKIGSKTIEAINKHQGAKLVVLYNKFNANRKQWYKDITEKSVNRYKKIHPKATEADLKKYTKKEFIGGWLNRVAEFATKTITNILNVNC